MGRGLRKVCVAVVCFVAVGRAAEGIAGEPVVTASARSSLVFAGSGGSLASVRLLADAFVRMRPDAPIEVPPSIGSTGAVRAVAEGAIAAGMLTRPLREAEQALGLTTLTYARTAIVIGAHPSVADDGITTDDLVKITRGMKTRWKDGSEIVVLTREKGDSTIEFLERMVPGFAEAYAESQRVRRWATFFTDQEMAAALARSQFAIGFSDVGTVTAGHLPIKVLKLNGALPTAENVASGRYPWVKSISFVFRKDRLPPGAKAFIDFARSAEGRRVLTANGYLPGS